MSPAWRGACQLAAAAVRTEVRKLDKAAKAGLVVDPEQRRALGLLADWVAAAQHHGPEVLAGIAIQGTLREHLERKGKRRPMGFKPDESL
ncbi:hypothetical protein CYFUS_001712 [Cystobacter fuscus]|uniref:Uncharacterized protein n=1 Tax=Cystobacter fuscus TaxID=43 RepID=A0A250IYI0_9BACT|nr:hypothetical protein [Cystobacter fuscus]ATB36298.1 hypothetical protein CYFUS_001712 [Cystobacter fuscus]